MSDQDQSHTQEDAMQHQSDSAPPPAEAIDPRMEAIALRIGSAKNDPDRIGLGDVEAAIAALPTERHREIARQFAEGRPLAERAAERSIAVREDWDDVFARRRADRAADWRASVPREFANASVDRLAPEQHPDKIRAWWNGNRSFLILRSDTVGNGKTYAAYAVGNRVCDRVWCVAHLLSDLVRNEIARQSDPQMWRYAVMCELLVLDDVGQESGVSWKREEARDVLHRLLSARNGDPNRRTIITTNRDADWLEGKPTPDGQPTGYGSAVFDRMAGDAEVITFTGDSRRDDARSGGGRDWGDL